MKSKISLFSLTAFLLFNFFTPLKSETTEPMKTLNSSGKIKLFVYNGCPWCNKVIAYLKQINQFDKITLLDLSKIENMQELKKLNHDNTQAPFLFDEQKGVSMLESSDIIHYFSTRF